MKSNLATVSVKSGNLSDKVATSTIQTDRLNQLWISDFRHVSTWQGWRMWPLPSTYLLGMGIPV